MVGGECGGGIDAERSARRQLGYPAWVWLWRLRLWLCWWSRSTGEFETISEKHFAKQLLLTVKWKESEMSIIPFFFPPILLLLLLFSSHFLFYFFLSLPFYLHRKSLLIHSDPSWSPSPPRPPTSSVPSSTTLTVHL
jgi:hypothetical protein